MKQERETKKGNENGAETVLESNLDYFRLPNFCYQMVFNIPESQSDFEKRFVIEKEASK